VPHGSATEGSLLRARAQRDRGKQQQWQPRAPHPSIMPRQPRAQSDEVR